MWHVRAECCFKEKVVFVNLNKSKSCSDYNKAYIVAQVCAVLGDVPNLCLIEVCGNGAPPENYFCGVGDCNIFGCNCDFGCIPGDRIENFSHKYDKDIFVVR